jgi:putative ABC transport system permease protein
MLKFKLILREIIQAPTYTIQFILSILLGVGTVVGINSYKQNLQSAINKESKQIMGSDLLVESSARIQGENFDFVKNQFPKQTKFATSVYFSSMVYTKDKETSLALVKALDSNFPIYGEILTEPKNCFQKLKMDEAILEETLYKNLKLQSKKEIFIGSSKFRVACILKKEPALVGSFTSFAPTVIIPYKSLKQTGLEAKGSRIRYNILVGLADGINSKKFKEENFPKFIAKDLTLYHNTEIGSGSQRFINSTFDYMSLLGLSGFFLGAIAMIVSTRARLQDRTKTISILKCLGSSNSQISFLFLIEICILSLLGTILGIAFGYYFQFLVPNLTGSDFLNSVIPALTLKSILWGFLIGILLPIFISLESILKIQSLSPLQSIREEFSEKVKISFFLKRIELIEILLLYIVFYLLASFETESFLKGLILSGVLFILPLLLYFSYQLLRLILKYFLIRLEWKSELRFVFQKISSAGSGLLLPIIGIGSGLTILLLSLMIKTSLLQLSGANQLERRPNIFAVDIRKDQIDLISNLQKKFSAEQIIISPIIGARLSKINNVAIQKEDTEKDAIKRDWRATAKTREYNLSYRDNLYKSEKIDKGVFWNENSKDEISVESDFAKSLGVKIGDSLEFNIGGVELSGKITNFRSVNWADMKPNFVVLFSRGILESAPGYFVSSFLLESSTDRYEFQKEIVASAPNITIIDAEKTLQNFTSIIEKVSGVIGLMTAIIVISGILLLLSSLYANKKNRSMEASLFRTLGANNKSLLKIYFIEASLLAIYSFSCATILSLTANFFISRFLLNLKLQIPVIELFLIFILTYFICTVIYLFSLREIFVSSAKEFSRKQGF